MREEIEKFALGPVEPTEDGGRRSFRYGDDFIGFAGHFPDYPILPAVLQILMTQSVAEQVIGRPLRFLALERAKFTRQLRPGDRIDVSVDCREKQGQVHCVCGLRVAEKPAAAFTLVLAQGLEQ